MPKETHDALLQYVNHWGRLAPARDRDTGPQTHGKREGGSATAEWPFMDAARLELELREGLDPSLALAALEDLRQAVADWRMPDLSEVLADVQRALDPAVLAEALHRGAEPALRRLYELIDSSGGAVNARIRVGRMLRRLAMDFIAKDFERQAVALSDIIDLTQTARGGTGEAPSVTYQCYGPFPAEDVQLFVDVYQYGLALGGIEVAGRSGWGEVFVFAGMWDEEFRDRNVQLLLAEHPPQRQEVFPLQDAALAIRQFFTIARGEYPSLGACRAPTVAKRRDGGGACRTIFVDRSRGCDRLCCAGRCKARLRRWRKKHGHTVYEVPESPTL